MIPVLTEFMGSIARHKGFFNRSFQDSTSHLSNGPAAESSRRSFLKAALTLGLASSPFGPLSRVVFAQPSQSRFINVARSGATRHPRPFYIIGHATNTIDSVKSYLSEGANAIETDVNVYGSRPDELCIDHGPKLWSGGSPDEAPSLEEYLSGLHEVARRSPELSLVYFDCKPPVATPGNGAKLIKAIRQHLIRDGSVHLDLNVIISVAKLKEFEMFDLITADSQPREGFMIDEEDDPTRVAEAFSQARIVNQCFGNGSSVFNSSLGFHLRPSIEQACSLKTQGGQFRFVSTFTVNDIGLMRQYIRIGVAGLIVDQSPPCYNGGIGLKGLVDLVEGEGSELGIYKANRLDSPFSPSLPNSVNSDGSDIHPS